MGDLSMLRQRERCAGRLLLNKLWPCGDTRDCYYLYLSIGWCMHHALSKSFDNRPDYTNPPSNSIQREEAFADSVHPPDFRFTMIQGA